jgi:hypothetical protein
VVIAAHWYVMYASAGVLTLYWLFHDRENLAFSTLMASGLWFYTAFQGGDLTRITQSGTTVATSATELQYVALALGLTSLLARFLYSFGEYPPNTHNDTEASGGNTASPAD